MNIRLGRRRLLLSALASSIATPGLSQQRPQGLPGNYPNKPIRVLVGVSPGGGADISTRLVINKLAERWNHPFIIENVAGANGVVAMNMVARAAPDGYTLLSSANSSLVTAALMARPEYDIRTAFAPIALFTSQPYVLAVSNALPVNTLKEFLAHAKSRPGQLNYASSGLGGSSHIGMEQFNLMAGVKTEHIPYKGIGPGINDLLGGRIHLLFGSVLSVMPQVRNGRMKALAVTSARRSPLLPDLPAIAEEVPGFDMTGWYGLLGPAGLPVPIINAINHEIGAIMASPEMTEKLAAVGAEAPQASPAQFRELMLRELDNTLNVIKKTGLKLEQ